MLVRFIFKPKMRQQLKIKHEFTREIEACMAYRREDKTLEITNDYTENVVDEIDLDNIKMEKLRALGLLSKMEYSPEHDGYIVEL